MSAFSLIIILISLFNYNYNFELSKEKIDVLDDSMNEFMKKARLHTVGIIITDKEKTLYQKIYGEDDKIDTKSPFILGSVTKSFTAMALVKSGIDLNQTIDKYELNDYISKDKAKDITISQLIHHTSGLDQWGPRFVAEKGQFYYSNYGYALLGKILKNHTGKDYHDYMNDNIFKPLEMDNTRAKYNSDIIESYDNFFGFRTKYKKLESEFGDGFYVPAGFISSSIEDMGKYIRYYLNYSKDDAISNMIKGEGNVEVDYNVDYGMGLAVRYFDKTTSLEHDGETASFLSDLFIYPELECGFFIVTNTRDFFVQQPWYDLVESFERFLLNDYFFDVNTDPFFFTHFTIDLIIIIYIGIPISYLIVTIYRKVKMKEYTWFVGVKGIIIFIVDVFMLLIVPSAVIICLYVISGDIKYITKTTRDLRFGIFTTLSTTVLTFLIKLIYMLLYEKYIKKHTVLKDKKIDIDLEYMGVEDEK